MTGPLAIAIVGAGPRAVGIVDQLIENAPQALGNRPLEIHLIDPFPPGAGRVWRADQPELLWMNSTTQDVSMFASGPSLWDWITRVGRFFPYDTNIGRESRLLRSNSFASRRLQSAYLRWCFERVLDRADSTVGVHVHRARAVDITETGDGRQRVWIDRGGDPHPLVDSVVLAQGHLDVFPSSEESAFQAFANRHGLGYWPTGYTADLCLDAIPDGEPVIVRGLGQAFTDYVVLLTLGRGGSFVREKDGRLEYVPSGREPFLLAGSGRGVPYRSKIPYSLPGTRPPLPRFFTPDAVEQLHGSHQGRTDSIGSHQGHRGANGLWFRRDLLPLIHKEIGWAYYHELFHGHSDRVAMSWCDFESSYAALDWSSEEMLRLIPAAVPKREDRLDFDALDRPLAGKGFDSLEEFQAWMVEHVEADVARRTDPYFSADAAAILALLSCYGTVASVADRLDPLSLSRDVDGDWHGFFSYLASGPPPRRLEELMALSRAGIVWFLGADLRVSADERHRVFRATTATTPDTIEARFLVEARLPMPDVERTTDPLVRRLLHRGDATGSRGRLRVQPGSSRLLRADGFPHDSLYAVGPWTTGGGAFGGFAKPGPKTPLFRHNDTLARSLLGR